MREKIRITTRGQRARGNSAQMLADYYHNHCSKRFRRGGGGLMLTCVCVFLFHCLSVLNLLAQFKLSVSLPRVLGNDLGWSTLLQHKKSYSKCI